MSKLPFLVVFDAATVDVEYRGFSDARGRASPGKGDRS